MDHATMDHDALTSLLARPLLGDEPVVSLYFATHGRIDARRVALEALTRVGEEAIERLPARPGRGPEDGLREAAGVALGRAHGAVAAALDRADGDGTVVAFAWKDRAELHRLPLAVADRIEVGRTPYMSPLSELLEHNERYGVVIVDHERARICESFMGDVRQLELVQDEFAQNIAHAGALGLDQSRMNHHREYVLHRHLEHVAGRLFAHHKRRPFDRLVLAGLPESVSKLERSLHAYIRGLVVARERWDHAVTTAEIAERMKPIEASGDAEKESRVLALVRTHGTDGLATQGFEATARALADRKIATLLVERGRTLPGHACTACQALLLLREDEVSPLRCPSCGGETRRVADVLHEATEVARSSGAQVVTIDHARAELALLGGIASILRFR
jgi:Zn ribbon nucleic-acid-binding protein